MSYRIERLNELFRRELNNAIVKDSEDPRLKFCTITRVEITKDLSRARCFFSVLGKEKKQKKTMKGLISAEGFFKSRIANKIRLRRLPKLFFIFDENLKKEMKVLEILDHISKLEKKQNNSFKK